MTFINGLLGPMAPPPRVVPLSSGGLQLEWHRHGIDLEVVFDLNERPFFFYRNHNKGEESEHPLPEQANLLRDLINQLR